MESICYSCKILIKLKFLGTFSKKKIKILDFIKIRPVGDELFRGDGWTDMTKLIVASLSTVYQQIHWLCIIY
jgi:hypothetical protein